jgi:arylsulfatase
MNLRRDPFERADFNSNTYWDWIVDHAPQLYLMQDAVAKEIEGFVKFPPRQKPASFNLDAVMAQAQGMAHLAQSQKRPSGPATATVPQKEPEAVK